MFRLIATPIILAAVLITSIAHAEILTVQEYFNIRPEWRFWYVVGAVQGIESTSALSGTGIRWCNYEVSRLETVNLFESVVIKSPELMRTDVPSAFIAFLVNAFPCQESPKPAPTKKK